MLRPSIPLLSQALLLAVLVAPARAQASIELPGPGAQPYRVLDDVLGSWIGLNIPTVRPMCRSQVTGALWALNSHASRLVRFSPPSSAPACGSELAPDASYPLPWLPISCGIWTDPDAGTFPERVVVACAGTHGIAVVRTADGKIVEFLPLESEPGDLLIDEPTSRAWISLPTVDAIAEIELRALTVRRTWPVRSKHPLFLSRDGDGVLVAPMISGNNSVVHKREVEPKREALSLGILDLETVATVPLPDHDLFRLDLATDELTPVASVLGTLLFGHGKNPFDGRLWVLNEELLNKDPLKQSEAAIRGRIVENRATLVDLGTGAKTTVVLDQPSNFEIGGIDPTKTVGQPWSLDFVPLGQTGAGTALVVGVQTDNLTAFGSGGAFLWNRSLPDGAIPRAVRWDPDFGGVLVYCWGTNEVLVFPDPQGSSCSFALDLGFDSASAAVQAGRAHFYDASNSRYNNSSCATCHVEGRTDMEEWNLSNLPQDDKGPMVTQTLAGIDRLMTFHWRGEQQNGLIDFNPAFVNLLGGEELSIEQFALFERFVLSIQSPANPNQSPWRVVDNQYAPAIPEDLPPGPLPEPLERGDAVLGQSTWFDTITVANRFTCNDCHSAPTGSNNDIVPDQRTDPLPERKFFLSTGFNEMWRKRQEVVEVTFPSPLPGVGTAVQRYPLIGAGFSHAGAVDSLFEFNEQVLNGTLTQLAVDVEAFVHMWDSGLAPAAHRALLMSAGNHAQAAHDVQVYLIDQAEKGWIDLAVFGKVDGAAARWLYDRSDDHFLKEDRVTRVRLSYFESEASIDGERNLFLGLPLGTGERFALDYDGDDLFNGEEAARGTDPYDVDSDNDGFWDGNEVLHGSDPTIFSSTPVDATKPVLSPVKLHLKTTSQAKISFSTDEPTTFQLDYTASIGGVFFTASASDDEPKKLHSVVIRGLLPSTTSSAGPVRTVSYTGTLTVRDRAGNETVRTLASNPGSIDPGIQTLPFTEQTDHPGPRTTVTGQIAWAATTAIPSGIPSQPSWDLKAGVRIDRKIGGPPPVPEPSVVLVARVLIRRQNQGVPEVSTSFQAAGSSARAASVQTTDCGCALPMAGPFLISNATNGSGVATLRFVQDGLAPGDVVILQIEGGATLPGSGYVPTAPVFSNLNRWSFADTKAIHRELRFAVPPP